MPVLLLSIELFLFVQSFCYLLCFDVDDDYHDDDI